MSKLPATRLTSEEMDVALATFALCRGNGREAAKQLREQGIRVSHQTLYRWANRTHVERYENVYRELLPAIRERAAQRLDAQSESAAEVAATMLDRLRREADGIPLRDLPGAVRNVAVAGGIAQDKARDLRGEPTHVIENRTADETWAQLRAMGLVANEKPEQVVDAEVVGEGS